MQESETFTSLIQIPLWIKLVAVLWIMVWLIYNLSFADQSTIIFKKKQLDQAGLTCCHNNQFGPARNMLPCFRKTATSLIWIFQQVRPHLLIYTLLSLFIHILSCRQSQYSSLGLLSIYASVHWQHAFKLQRDPAAPHTPAYDYGILRCASETGNSTTPWQLQAQRLTWCQPQWQAGFEALRATDRPPSAPDRICL